MTAAAIVPASHAGTCGHRFAGELNRSDRSRADAGRWRGSFAIAFQMARSSGRSTSSASVEGLGGCRRRSSRPSNAGLSGDQLVQNQTQRVEIGLLRQFGTRNELFRRHVGRRPDDGVLPAGAAGHRNAKIGDPHEAVAVDEHVRRLQVAMEDALGVGGRKTVAELLADIDHFFRRQPPDAANQRGEVFAIDQFHGVEDFSFAFTDVEHAADRRMRDLPGESHLIKDVPPALGVVRIDQLQGDRGFEDEVVGPPDFTHAPASQPGDHPVPAGEDIARDEACGVGGGADVGRRRGHCGVAIHMSRLLQRDETDLPSGPVCDVVEWVIRFSAPAARVAGLSVQSEGSRSDGNRRSAPALLCSLLCGIRTDRGTVNRPYLRVRILPTAFPAGGRIPCARSYGRSLSRSRS